MDKIGLRIAELEKNRVPPFMNDCEDMNEALKFFYFTEMPNMPEDYFDFIIGYTDGFGWNGKVLYGSEMLFLDENCRHPLKDIWTANEYWQQFRQFENKMVLGEGDDDLYVFNSAEKVYEIVDRNGKDALLTFKTFEELFLDVFR